MKRTAGNANKDILQPQLKKAKNMSGMQLQHYLEAHEHFNKCMHALWELHDGINCTGRAVHIASPVAIANKHLIEIGGKFGERLTKIFEVIESTALIEEHTAVTDC